MDNISLIILNPLPAAIRTKVLANAKILAVEQSCGARVSRNTPQTVNEIELRWNEIRIYYSNEG